MVSMWGKHTTSVGNTWYLCGKNIPLVSETHGICVGMVSTLNGKYVEFVQETYGTHILSKINPTWDPCLTHLRFLYGSYVGSPYKAHTEAHINIRFGSPFSSKVVVCGH